MVPEWNQNQDGSSGESFSSNNRRYHAKQYTSRTSLNNVELGCWISMHILHLHAHMHASFYYI